MFTCNSELPNSKLQTELSFPQDVSLNQVDDGFDIGFIVS